MTTEKGPEPSYHTYEHNPAPWWIIVLWIAYFVFATSYLVINLSS